MHHSMNVLLRSLRHAVERTDEGNRSDYDLLEGFVTRHDERDFEALVQRHGSLVFGVCRRVVGNVQDAEDAFQATFLVLARRAGAIARREQLANWLYGVAYRSALEIRRRAVRRASREKQVDDLPHPLVEMAVDNSDLAEALDNALHRLPDKYRVPILLCDLKNLSRRDAAAQIGIPEGTLSSRLATGRQKLARRLTQRGVGLSSAALTAALIEQSAICAPPDWITTTVDQAVVHTEAVSPQVGAAANTILKLLWWNKMKRIIYPLAFVVLLSGVLGALAFFPGQHDPANPQKKKQRLAAEQNNLQQPTPKPPLRYDNKLFNEWHAVLQSELKPARLIEAVKAMQAFGINGNGKEASHSLIEFVKKYRSAHSWELSSKSDPVIHEVVAAFRTINQPAAPILMKAAESDNANARRVAVEALGRFKSVYSQPATMVRIVKSGLDDKDVGVRIRATNLIGNIRPYKNALRLLSKAQADKDDRVRRGAVAEIPYIAASSSEAATPHLLIALQDPDVRVREAAIRLLSRQGGFEPKHVVLGLEKLLTVPDENLHRELARFLRLRDPEAAKTAAAMLIKNLQNQMDWKIKHNAILALGELGFAAKDALPLLEKISAQDNTPIQYRDAAVRAYNSINSNRGQRGSRGGLGRGGFGGRGGFDRGGSTRPPKK